MQCGVLRVPFETLIDDAIRMLEPPCLAQGAGQLDVGRRCVRQELARVLEMRNRLGRAALLNQRLAQQRLHFERHGLPAREPLEDWQRLVEAALAEEPRRVSRALLEGLPVGNLVLRILTDSEIEQSTDKKRGR